MKTHIVSDSETQNVLACLAVPSRFRLVRCIAEAERCVGELALAVGLSQSCTTRHLQALERAGLISRKRDGRRVLFTLRAEAAPSARVLELVLEAETPAKAGSSREQGAKPMRTEGMTNESGGRGIEGVADVEPPAPSRRHDLEDYLL